MEIGRATPGSRAGAAGRARRRGARCATRLAALARFAAFQECPEGATGTAHRRQLLQPGAV